jgi:hypothetical protein
VVAVGVAHHEQQRGAGCAHRLRVDVDPQGTEPPVLGQDVRRLDADPAAAGLTSPIGGLSASRPASPGGADLQPAVLAVLAEARVAADLEPELLV